VTFSINPGREPQKSQRQASAFATARTGRTGKLQAPSFPLNPFASARFAPLRQNFPVYGSRPMNRCAGRWQLLQFPSPQIHLIRPYQPEEHGAIRTAQRQRHLVGLRRAGHVGPIRPEAGGQVAGLRLQLPARVVRRPVQMQLIGSLDSIQSKKLGRRPGKSRSKPLKQTGSAG
jgi:hypothetical protein